MSISAYERINTKKFKMELLNLLTNAEYGDGRFNLDLNINSGLFLQDKNCVCRYVYLRLH